MRRMLDYLRLVNATHQRSKELEQAVIDVEGLLIRLLNCGTFVRCGECAGCGVNLKETNLHKSGCPVIQAKQLRQQRSDDPLERLLIIRTEDARDE